MGRRGLPFSRIPVHNMHATPCTMNDANLAPRLGPLLRLRTATADLLAGAEAAQAAGDSNHTADSTARIRTQLESFDRRIEQLRRTLSRTAT